MNNERPFKRGRGGNFNFRGRGRGGWRKSSKSNVSNMSVEDLPAVKTKKNMPSQAKINTFLVNSSPYPGWKLYFLDEEYSSTNAALPKIKAFEAFINDNGQLFPANTIEESRFFNVDYKGLLQDGDFGSSWGTFEKDLRDEPERTVGCLGLAMHQVLLRRLEDEAREENGSTGDISLPIIRCRVLNVEPLVHLKDLKSSYYGKLITARGTIIRVGSIRLLCTWMAFECSACQSVTSVRQPEGVHTPPSQCSADGCRSRNFVPLLSSAFTLTTNWQCVRMQETVADEDFQKDGGRVPRTLDCELTADLVDSCSPGDLVTLTGVVKVSFYYYFPALLLSLLLCGQIRQEIIIK